MEIDEEVFDLLTRKTEKAHSDRQSARGLTRPIGLAPMTNRRGGIPGLGLVRYIVNRHANIGPYESWPIPTGLSPKFSRGTCVLPTYTPLHGNNLHTIYEKRSPMIQGPLTPYPPRNETPLNMGFKSTLHHYISTRP